MVRALEVILFWEVYCLFVTLYNDLSLSFVQSIFYHALNYCVGHLSLLLRHFVFDIAGNHAFEVKVSHVGKPSRATAYLLQDIGSYMYSPPNHLRVTTVGIVAGCCHHIHLTLTHELFLVHTKEVPVCHWAQPRHSLVDHPHPFLPVHPPYLLQPFDEFVVVVKVGEEVQHTLQWDGSSDDALCSHSASHFHAVHLAGTISDPFPLLGNFKLLGDSEGLLPHCPDVLLHVLLHLFPNILFVNRNIQHRQAFKSQSSNFSVDYQHKHHQYQSGVTWESEEVVMSATLSPASSLLRVWEVKFVGQYPPQPKECQAPHSRP